LIETRKNLDEICVTGSR